MSWIGYLTTFDGEDSVLEIWEAWKTPPLPLLPGQLWSEMVVPVKLPSMGQINLFKDYLYSVGISDDI